MNADQPKPKLNLYVVGEISGDPERWSPYGSRKIVLATSETQALEITESSSSQSVHMVNASQPIVLVDEYYSGD